MREYQYKILVVGDLGTGKTSILRRFVYNTFSSHYKSTIGVDFALKLIQQAPDLTISLQLWDIAGQERFGNMTKAYYRGATGAFVVYDVSRPSTFQGVLKWKQDIDDKAQLRSGQDIPIVLIVNKIDQHNNPHSKEEMDQFCIENGFVHWFETSAKENTGVVEAAKFLVDTLVGLESTSSSSSEYELDYNGNRISLYEPSKHSKPNKSSCC